MRDRRRRRREEKNGDRTSQHPLCSSISKSLVADFDGKEEEVRGTVKKKEGGRRRKEERNKPPSIVAIASTQKRRWRTLAQRWAPAPLRRNVRRRWRPSAADGSVWSPNLSPMKQKDFS